MPEEKALLVAQARASGYKLSTYLLRVGMGYRIKGVLDNQRVEELILINADLGRLGGLLKLWLTNDERTKTFGEPTIRAVLSKIAATQDSMQEIIELVVLPKGRR